MQVPPDSLLNAAARALGSRGGKARAKNLSAKRRSAIASQGGKARWNGKKTNKNADKDAA